MGAWINLIGLSLLMGLDQPQVTQIASAPAPSDESALIDPVTGEIFDLTPNGQRLTVDVLLGDHGPHSFLIDTGAQRTSISRQLAHSLGLNAGPDVRLVSMSGISMVPTVRLPSIQLSPQTRTLGIDAPALDGRHIGAAGLLGTDALAGHRVVIDLDANQMTVRPSQPRHLPAERDEIVVEARSVGGQLILTDAYYKSQRIRVIIDTGTSVSIGNTALRKRIAQHQAQPGRVSITSVTGGTIIADYSVVDSIDVGPMHLNGLAIAFSDVEPFRRLGLTDKPALLLGMDVLQNFRKVEIDFRSREIRFLLPRDTPRLLSRR